MTDKSSLIDQLKINREINPDQTGSGHRLGLAGALLGGVLLILGAGGAWALVSAHSGIPVHAAIAAAVPDARAWPGGSLLDASGYVVARRQSTASSNVIAKVNSVLVEEGDHVKQGQVIAELDDTNFRASLAQAVAGVKQARAQLAAAKVASADAEPVYQRNVVQLKQKLISQSAFDAAKATYDATLGQTDVAQQNLTVAQAALAVAQSNEDYTTIRAPFAGVVTTKNAQPGDIVSYSFSGGGGIAQIVDMNSLEVQVDVSESFINRVHAGQPATIQLNAYPNWDIPAEVIAIIPTADQNKATVKVRVAFKTHDNRILPQMGARVSFQADAQATGSSTSPPSVAVPPDAVQAVGETGTVFVINGEVVSKRTVKLGGKTADGEIILSGLKPGVRLAVADLNKLTDGARVRVLQ